MVWKKVNNSDAGTATKHGGNDIDKITEAFNGNTVSDPIIFRTDFNTLRDSTNAAGDLLKGNGTKYVRFARGTANQVLAVNSGGTDLEWTSSVGGGATNLTGLSDVTITSAARGDIIVRNATEYVNKAKGTANQFLRMDATATDVIWSTVAPIVETYTYYIYKDPADSLFKARKGSDGSILATTSATNVTVVLDAVVADINPPTTPTVIVFGSGDFPMTTIFNNITVPVIGNLTIRGQGMGATNLIAGSAITVGTVFEIFGAVSGSQTNLTANAAAGAVTIDVTSAAAFAAGDTILLRSTAAFSTAASAQGKKGEIHKIASKSSNTITLDKWTHDNYDTAATANIIKVATLDNVTLEDISLKAGSGYTGTGTFFGFLFCDNLRINRVHVQNSLGMAFDVRSCINFTADVTIEQTPNATFNQQYGFKVTSASENGFARVTAIGKWRHAVTIDASGTANLEGQVRNIEFTGNAETSSEAAWDTHATGENISFRNCNVQASRSDVSGTADAKGFQIRSKKSNVQNCNVWETVGKGITLMEDASGSIVSGCNINRSRQLPGNSTLGHGIEIRSGCNDCVISGNNIEGSHREAILLRTTSSGHVITGNIINGSNNEGIDAADITDVVISGNRIINCAKAINMTGTSNYWVITGNNFHTNSAGSTIIGANTINQNNAI